MSDRDIYPDKVETINLEGLPRFNVLKSDDIVNIQKLPEFELKKLVENTESKLSEQQETINRLEKRFERQEFSRRIVAAFLLSSIGGTILATFVYLFLPFFPNVEEPTNSDDAKELITLLWTSQIGLIGSAIGYYFGSGSNLDSKK